MGFPGSFKSVSEKNGCVFATDELDDGLMPDGNSMAERVEKIFSACMSILERSALL